MTTELTIEYVGSEAIEKLSRSDAMVSIGGYEAEEDDIGGVVVNGESEEEIVDKREMIDIGGASTLALALALPAAL